MILNINNEDNITQHYPVASKRYLVRTRSEMLAKYEEEHDQGRRGRCRRQSQPWDMIWPSYH